MNAIIELKGNRNLKGLSNKEVSYSKSTVQKAGKDLTNARLIQVNPERFRACMDILSSWRANHITALNEVTQALKEISKSVDKNAIVVSRLKRIPSIISKLRKNPTMNLSRMQDIAGCRAIAKNTKSVERIKRKLKRKYQLKEKNYIKEPKPDGYRSIHLIGKHKNSENKNSCQVEIQLRTQLQHAWATAVEIVDLFTNQNLKQDIGNDNWKKFFLYTSNEFAKLEGEYYSEELNSQQELPKLTQKLDIYRKFEAFQLTLRYIENIQTEHVHALITIDTREKVGNIKFFKKKDFKEATKNYLEGEKESAQNKNLVVALVNVASIKNLREAYPNYFADSTLFIENLREVSAKQPNRIVKFFTDWLNSTGLVNKETLERNI